MVVAQWNGQVIARSDDTVVVEGNQYFPWESVNHEFLRPNEETSTCIWKGVAGYFDVVVDGQTNRSAAWIYRDPKPAAKAIKNHIAFWKGVEVREA